MNFGMKGRPASDDEKYDYLIGNGIVTKKEAEYLINYAGYSDALEFLARENEVDWDEDND